MKQFYTIPLLVIACAITQLTAQNYEPGYPHIPENGYGVFVTADALIWKAQQSGREFTRLVDTENNAARGLGIIAVQPCNKYEPGFRLGLGYTLPCHQEWDLYGYYTQLNSAQSRTVVPTDDKRPVVTASVNPSYAGAFVSEATACWNLHFKNFDFEAGRKFLLSDDFRLRYHIGLRAAQIHERYLIGYSAGISLADAATPAMSIFLKNNFSGVGLQTGLNTEVDLLKNWCWCPGEWSFYADASVALLSGKSKAFGSEKHADTLFSDGCGSYGIMKAAFDLGAGLRWNKMLWCDRVNFRLQLGWEQHYYPNIWIWVPSIHTAGNGDFALTGLVISARVDF